MRTRQTRKLLASALGLIALGSIWFYFAPAPLGGSSTYVVTKGISMEPRFHTGDLAIVRSQSSYHVGEIVAYHNYMLHTVVLHRIIGREGPRYLFKGDNNHFVDPEHPLGNQLIGALWLHLPGVGGRLQAIRSPGLIGLLIALGVLTFTGGAFTRQRRRRGKDRRTGESAAPSQPWRMPQHPDGPVAGVLGVGVLALAPFVVLALLAFTSASTRRASFDIPYEQHGRLSYSAAATPGPTYPGNRAVTGDALFTHVLNTVNLSYSYLFNIAAKHSLSGEASLSATVSSTSGWKSTFALGAPKHFAGDHALATGTLEVSSLLALMHSVEAATGVKGNYTLTIAPHVSAGGTVETAPLHTTLSPQIKFTLSELEIQPAAAPSTSLFSQQPAADPFTTSSSSSARGTHSVPRYVSLGIVAISVSTARAVATVAIVILLGCLLAVLALIRPLLALVRPPRSDESDAIKARYGGLIVPVARVGQIPGVPVIDVEDMDALVRIAEHYDRSILHETNGGVDSFWVTDESGQFRYTVGGCQPSGVQEPPVAPHIASEVTLDYEPVTEELPVLHGVHERIASSNGHGPVASYEAEVRAAEPVFSPPFEPDHPLVEQPTSAHHRRKPVWASDDEQSLGAAFIAGQPAEEVELYAEVYADELELSTVIGDQTSQPGGPRRGHPSRTFGTLTGSSS
jgi:signal peptidase I